MNFYLESMLSSFKEYLKYRNLNYNREKLNLYLSNFPIEENKVGRRIAQGLQHFVYEYGKDEVIKVPKFDILNLLYGTLNPSDVKRDNKLIQKYFEKYAVPTKVYSSRDRQLYCIVQERIKDRINITSSNIHLVLKDFMDVYRSNKNLETFSGYSLDLWGRSGILKSIRKSINKSNIFIEMTNVIIEKDEGGNYKLKIIDTNLFRIDISLARLARVFTDKIIYGFSDYILRKARFIE